MINQNNYTVLMQLEHVAGQNSGVGRIILVAHQAVELILEGTTTGQYRKTMMSVKVSDLWGRFKPERSTQGNNNIRLSAGVETDSSTSQPNTITKSPDSSPVAYFPGTTVPLLQVIGGLAFFTIITTIGEFIYENRSPQGSYCNIPQPPGPPVSHKREFHKEFLIPTSIFPQEFFLENIEKKSTLDQIAIFEDFVFYQGEIIKVFKLISNVSIRFILFLPCSELATIAVDSALKQFKGRFQILTVILKLAIAFAVTNQSAEYLKRSTKVSFILVVVVFLFVQMVIIKVYQFNKNKVIWVVECIKNK